MQTDLERAWSRMFDAELPDLFSNHYFYFEWSKKVED
jgi:hypothetical protein